MSIVAAWFDSFLWGALVIVRVFAIAVILTILWGMLGAAAKLSNTWLLQKLANAYTTIFRGTPELLVVLILYFGSAITLTWLAKKWNPAIKFVDIPPFWAGALAISLIVGASLSFVVAERRYFVRRPARHRSRSELQVIGSTRRQW